MLSVIAPINGQNGSGKKRQQKETEQRKPAIAPYFFVKVQVQGNGADDQQDNDAPADTKEQTGKITAQVIVVCGAL